MSAASTDTTYCEEALSMIPAPGLVSSHEHRPHWEPKTVHLYKEQDRLITFVGWPKEAIIPASTLARNGFFYIGHEDTVRCYFCIIELAHWEPQDDVAEQHRRWSRHCPLVKGGWTNNIPLEGSLLSSSELPQQPVYDTVGLEPLPDEPPTTATAGGSNSSPEPSHGTVDFTIPAATHNRSVLAENEFLCQSSRKFPLLALFADRLGTFRDWPKALAQQPEQLADAGFFYAGTGDMVTCFSCGGQLRDWEPQDDPWEEHAKYYGYCSYLSLLNGSEFIKQCQGKVAVRKSNETTALEGKPEGEEALPATGDEVAEIKLCRICYEAEFNTVFMPCGHVVACAKCAASVKKCPLCNMPYTAVIRVYLP